MPRELALDLKRIQPWSWFPLKINCTKIRIQMLTWQLCKFLIKHKDQELCRKIILKGMKSFVKLYQTIW
jgi:hypothetical protein